MLQLAESQLTQRLFTQIIRRIERLACTRREHELTQKKR